MKCTRDSCATENNKKWVKGEKKKNKCIVSQLQNIKIKWMKRFFPLMHAQMWRVFQMYLKWILLLLLLVAISFRYIAILHLKIVHTIQFWSSEQPCANHVDNTMFGIGCCSFHALRQKINNEYICVLEWWVIKAIKTILLRLWWVLMTKNAKCRLYWKLLHQIQSHYVVAVVQNKWKSDELKYNTRI